MKAGRRGQDRRETARRAHEAGLAAYLRAVARRPSAAERALGERLERLQDEVWTLREAAERYRSALEAAGDVVLRCGPDRAVLFVNDGFAATFGLGPEAVLGRPVDQVLDRFRLAPQPEGHGAGDRAMATLAGPRWFQIREIPLSPRPTDPSTVQVMLRDVGDRRAIEAELRAARDMAEAASAAKSRFLALASHEIRTPLNGILGMADLLIDTPLTSEQQAYVRAVRSSGDALLSLIDDVLDLAKIEAGRLDLAPAPARIEEVVEAVVELIAPRAQAKGIELAAHVAADVPAWLAFDAQRLRQVLINLAGNAVKFTETGGVAVEVARVDASAAGVRLRVAVRDTGIGIAATDLERIFAEYEQAETGPARRYGGTGLGLAIARAIVRQMGGDITVESRPGGGSTFAFTLDLAPAPAGSAPPPVEARVAGRRILIVSPGRIDPVLLARRLADLGAAPSVAADLAAARRALGEGPADVLLVDRRPDFDAGAVLAALGPQRPPAGVLLCPADRGALDRLKQAGFAGYLVKPVRARSLAMVTAALAEGRALASDATDARVPPPAGPRPATRRLAVLVADDNAINALLARAVLAGLGHDAATVPDGRRAVEAVAEARAEGRPFDAVLMDLHMPGLDGAAAIRAIRAAEPAGAGRTAILALTADATAAAERAALAAGADARLTKPIDPATLAAMLDQLARRPA